MILQPYHVMLHVMCINNFQQHFAEFIMYARWIIYWKEYQPLMHSSPWSEIWWQWLRFKEMIFVHPLPPTWSLLATHLAAPPRRLGGARKESPLAAGTTPTSYMLIKNKKTPTSYTRCEEGLDGKKKWTMFNSLLFHPLDRETFKQ